MRCKLFIQLFVVCEKNEFLALFSICACVRVNKLLVLLPKGKILASKKDVYVTSKLYSISNEIGWSKYDVPQVLNECLYCAWFLQFLSTLNTITEALYIDEGVQF